MGIPCRGSESVRTLAAVLGSGARSKERHVRQFRVGCLELERMRRSQEKASALRRVTEIDARLGQIDREIAEQHRALGYAGEPPAGERAAPAPPAPRRKVIRYGA